MDSMTQRNRSRSARRRRRRKLRKVAVRLVTLAVFAGMCICAARGMAAVLKKAVLSAGDFFHAETEQGTKLSDCPESLRELLERNPETQEFVLGYATRETASAEIDLSGEVTQGEIPLFLQWDKRWGYETYGDDFLAVTGCGPTCLAMVRCGLGGDTQWNPYAVATMAQESGYYVEGSGSSWELMTDGAQKIGLVSETVSFDEEHILEYLRAGRPIICSVGAGDFTTTGHFIVLCGADADGNIVVHDPNSRSNSEKTWDLERLMRQIKNLWGYRLA